MERSELREGRLGVRDVRDGVVGKEGWEGVGGTEEEGCERALTWKLLAKEVAAWHGV